jgi:hypothetical protein
MFEKLSYTWSLMGESWGVLKRDKELLLFPVLSLIGCLLVVASFAIPLYRSDFLAPPGADAPTARHVAYYGMLFLFYVCNYFVVIFFNAGIVACAVRRMEGGDPTVGYGLRAAAERLPQVMGWALLSATVGLVLRALEDRSKLVGQIVAGLLGTAWSVMTFLVVPVLVVEKKGPFEAAAESTRLLKHTWGEQIIGGVGFGLLFMFLAIPGVALIFAGAALRGGMLVLAVAGVAYLVILSLVHSALSVIFQSAVYLYARDGQAPGGFSTGLLSGAMRRR